MRTLTRRDFIKLSALTLGGVILSGCERAAQSFVPIPPTPTLAHAVINVFQPPTPAASTSGLFATQPDSGSKTNEFIAPQYWFFLGPDGKSFIRSPQPTITSPKSESISAPPKTVYIPANHFCDANISGLGKCKVGGEIPSGDYSYLSLAALQSIAITPDQLLRAEGSSELVNVFTIAEGGRLLLQGAILPNALINALQNGTTADTIEGPMAIPTNGQLRFVYRADLIKQAQQVQVIASKNDAISLQGAWPKDFAIGIGGNPFHPKDWKPPDKDPKKNCGIDLTDYFAYLLLSETVASIYVNNIKALNESGVIKTKEQYEKAVQEMEQKNPTLRKIREYEKKYDEVDKQLREGGCYFHTEGGSVFMDYKLMRHRAWMKIGGYKNPDLSAEEYAQIWNKDPLVQSAWRKGEQTLETMLRTEKNITTDNLFNLAKRLIEMYWW
jgi:hypothetical protein